MPSTFSTNLHLELQATGENSGTWGSLLNANDFQILDNALGAVQTISLSSSNVTLSTTQTQANTLVLTGALTADVQVIFPAIGRTYVVQNNTTGSHSVTLKITGSGATAVAVQGATQTYVLDSTNVYLVGVANNDQRLVPSGAMMEYGGATAPSGWLLCFGQAVSRTSFAALFTAIGTTYGAGDGSTTFNVPDQRGRVGAGADNMGGTAANRLTNSASGGVNGNALGNAGGEQSHTLIVNEMPSHSHTVSNVNTTHNGTGVDGGDPKYTSSNGGSVQITINNTGGSASHNNVQPTLIVNKIIKT